MQVSRIRLNCRRDKPITGDIGTNHTLYYFRSPVILVSGSRETPADSGTAVLSSGGLRHEFRPVKNNVLSFDCVSFRMTAADRQYVESLGIEPDEPVAVKDDYVLSGLLRCMRSQSVTKTKNQGEFMELSLRLVLLAVSSAADAVEDNERHVPRYAELKALREAIYDDPTGDWNSAVMAEDMEISRAYFHRIYFEAFGVTCRQDVIESRLMHAAELLKNSDLSISAIAEQCGYESESYFMRQFKQHKGMTPSEYRNSPEMPGGKFPVNLH